RVLPELPPRIPSLAARAQLRRVVARRILCAPRLRAGRDVHHRLRRGHAVAALESAAASGVRAQQSPPCLRRTQARGMSARDAVAWPELLKRLLAWNTRFELSDEAIQLDERSVPLRGRVARFRNTDGYNDSFALQWNKYRETQVDRPGGAALSRDRFLRETGWRLEDLAGQTILE